MMRRLSKWVVAMMIAIDQAFHVWLAGWTYVWLGRGPCPNADETISSRVGRNAAQGKRWALVCEFIIDGLFLLVGQRGHCRASVEQDELKGT